MMGRMMDVEIWSDVGCPRCAIGKVRFERALAAFGHADEVTVRWRSFELDRHAPASRDGDYAAMLAAKYRTTTDRAQAMIDRMVDQGAAEGLDFRFDIVKPGNTFDAHRVVHLAAERGLQHEVKDRFLDAYHSQGEEVGDHDVLVRLAADAGMDAEEVRAMLATDDFADAVRADEEQAVEYGISGVPFFVLDRRMGVSGAQPTEVLLQALEQAWAARTEDTAAAASHADHEHAGDTCGVDGCAVAS